MGTDTTERGLERLICWVLTGDPCDPPADCTISEPPAGYGGVGWSCGNHRDFNREYCVELVQLRAFLETTQLEAATALRLTEDVPARRGEPAQPQRPAVGLPVAPGADPPEPDQHP